MAAPTNDFKRRLLADGPPLAAVFAQLGDPSAAELCALTGFDLVIIDAEHGPNDLVSIAHQLRAVGSRGASAAVRCWSGERSVVKRVLDVGTQTIIVPMVESADEAADVVGSVRYPTAGARGVASARAAGWGTIPDYHATAADELCVIVQVESPGALEQLESICAVEGIDAVFVGPTDLSSAMGHLAQGTHPEVVPVVTAAIERIAAAGCAPAVFAATPDTVDVYVRAGARLVTLGVDAIALRSGLAELRGRLA
ncbi:MAG: HpcH/HpaI aldolase family protein [Ilumatobacter sp.]|uniref:HpcH/HpaI aldolase family protein n=1 Tax=Ilumatobacter sp. TaxID=1967498 RepID=UPI00391B580D